MALKIISNVSISSKYIKTRERRKSSRMNSRIAQSRINRKKEIEFFFSIVILVVDPSEINANSQMLEKIYTGGQKLFLGKN